MRILVGVLSALLVLGLAASVEAARGGGGGRGGVKAALKPLVGTVVSVDGTNVKISKKGKAGEAAQDVVVETDANTVITVDGVAAKLTDLQPGMSVKVTPSTGKATKIEATSKKAGAGGRNKNK